MLVFIGVLSLRPTPDTTAVSAGGTWDSGIARLSDPHARTTRANTSGVPGRDFGRHVVMCGYEVVYKGFLLLLGIPVYLGMKYAAARRGTHVVATGVAESVAAHGAELHLPTDLDAALARVIEAERRQMAR